MEKKSKEKPIKEVVFSTRNKAVILHSKMYSPEKTNELLDECFSNDIVVSKLLEAEKHGFIVSYSSEKNKEGVMLRKKIKKPELDATKCEEKYWEKVTENLLKFYDEETTDAIIEHYNPLTLEDAFIETYNPLTKEVKSREPLKVIYNQIAQHCTNDSSNAKKLGIRIEFFPNAIKHFSNIEKKVDNKIIKYVVKWEEIVSVFIESHIQVFG